MICCPHCGHSIIERKAGEPRFGLTPIEKKLLAYLVSHNAEHGVYPTFKEMCLAMGTYSKSSIHRTITGLSDKQYITRLRSRARAIAVVPQ